MYVKTRGGEEGGREGGEASEMAFVGASERVSGMKLNGWMCVCNGCGAKLC